MVKIDQETRKQIGTFYVRQLLVTLFWSEIQATLAVDSIVMDKGGILC